MGKPILKESQSELLNSIPGIKHHFENRQNSFLDFLSDNDLRPEDLPEWKQVHGTQIGTIQDLGQSIGEVDGMQTSTARVPIAVRTADCVPILLSKKDGSMVGTIHAGWRGTFAKIVESFSDQVGGLKDWVAAVGPSISANRYEVSPQMIVDFEKKFEIHDATLWRVGDRNIDLQTLNALELKRLGIGGLDVLRYCTFEYKPSQSNELLYHSYRRDTDNSERQTSVIFRLSR